AVEHSGDGMLQRSVLNLMVGEVEPWRSLFRAIWHASQPGSHAFAVDTLCLKGYGPGHEFTNRCLREF
ncbi:MAG: hypothetical protein V3T64_05080, partial [Myxococcota bacterium]